MTLCRCLIVVVFVQLCAVRCYAASSTNLTLSACDYAAENLYVVNSTDTQQLFPAGYVECANTTGHDATLCEVCSCREKKVASVAGVTVAWVVCIGSGDAATRANNTASGQEYCGNNNKSSSSSDGFSVNVGESSSSTSSEVGITNGSDAGVISIPGAVSSSSADTSASANTSADVGDSCSFDTDSSSDGSSQNTDHSSTAPSRDGSNPQATNEDNVVSSGIGTVKPSQTDSATSPDQNIIRPSDNNGAHQLDTNNGASNDSSWSGERLTVVLSVMCGMAAVAAIAVFVAVRNDRAKKKKALGTPTDDYTDDESSLATPMTHRLDGRHRRGGHGNRYIGNNGLTDASDNTPLASIVVIGPDDDFHTPTAYTSARKLSGGYTRTDSAKASGGTVRFGNDKQNTAAAVSPSRHQFNVSRGPSVTEMPSPTHDPIFDSSNTQVSFSSSMSSEYDSAPPPRERGYQSEESSTDSFRMVSATYSDSIRDSDTSTASRQRLTSLVVDEEDTVTSNTIVSFDSSLSSLHSSMYDIRDTEASEYMHDSELNTNSSRVALSFDVGSASSHD